MANCSREPINPMNMSWGALLAQFGITVFSAAAIAYGAFKWFGKRWIEHRFSERLEAFRHAKNREIEALRGEVNALLDRTVKLHSKEFEVLPLAWDKMYLAYGAARQVANRGQSYPNVTLLTGDALQSQLRKLGLEQHEIEEIEKTAKTVDRQAAVNTLVDRQRMERAYALHGEMRSYLIANGIFIQPELKVKLRDLADLIWDALNERQFDQQYPAPGALDRWVKADELSNRGHTAYEEIEEAVQSRLWGREIAPHLNDPKAGAPS